MLFEVAGVGEAVGTVWTLVGSLPSVDVLVNLEVPELGEGLPAGGAAEGPLAGVGPQVGLQVGRRGEGLVAETAHARPPLLVPGWPLLRPKLRPHFHDRTLKGHACALSATGNLGAGHVRERSTVRRRPRQVVTFLSYVRPQGGRVVTPPTSLLLQAQRLIGRLCGLVKQPARPVVVGARLHQPYEGDHGTLIQALLQLCRQKQHMAAKHNCLKTKSY